MTTAAAPTAAGSRVTPIGLAGGAARASSGYAFLRIQRQARRLAEAFAAGDALDASDARRSLGPPKCRAFDAIFLRTLADRPDLAPGIFSRMFDRADPPAVVRFLGERSTAVDDLRIVSSLPKLPFLISAVRSTRSWLPPLFGR